jgi:hypothetical protein
VLTEGSCVSETSGAARCWINADCGQSACPVLTRVPTRLRTPRHTDATLGCVPEYDWAPTTCRCRYVSGSAVVPAQRTRLLSYSLCGAGTHSRVRLTATATTTSHGGIWNAEGLPMLGRALDIAASWTDKDLRLRMTERPGPSTPTPANPVPSTQAISDTPWTRSRVGVSAINQHKPVLSITALTAPIAAGERGSH